MTRGRPRAYGAVPMPHMVQTSVTVEMRDAIMREANRDGITKAEAVRRWLERGDPARIMRTPTGTNGE